MTIKPSPMNDFKPKSFIGDLKITSWMGEKF